MDGRQNSTAPDAAAHRPLNQQQTKLLAMVWTLVGLCVIFVSLRFYSKLSRRKRLWWDDFFLVIAALTLAVMGSLCIVTVRNGFGLHSYEVPRASWPVNFVLGNVLATMNIAGAIWSKTSWALTMLRLTTGWYKAFVWFAIVSVNVFMGFNAMILWIGCTPLEKAWNFLVPGYCWGMKIFYTWSIAIGSAYTLVLRPCLRPFPHGEANDSSSSLLGSHGCRLVPPALEAADGDADAQKGDDWRCNSHELGYLVR